MLKDSIITEYCSLTDSNYFNYIAINSRIGNTVATVLIASFGIEWPRLSLGYHYIMGNYFR